MRVMYYRSTVTVCDAGVTRSREHTFGEKTSGNHTDDTAFRIRFVRSPSSDDPAGLITRRPPETNVGP